MAVASLLMYDRPVAVAQANDMLWAGISSRLNALGIEAPSFLDRTDSYDSYWLREDLLLAQTCGFPYVKRLRGRVRLVATPVYSWPGGRGSDRASFIIVRSGEPSRDLLAFRGRRAAINDHLSNSGMNLFRAALAPLAERKPFFSNVLVTGGHLASIEAVRDGSADIASIDSVTWGLVAAHDPAQLAGLAILGETPMGPGLPLITALATTDGELAEIRQALDDTLADPELDRARTVLGLTGFAPLDDEDYAALSSLEEQAAALGYPALA